VLYYVIEWEIITLITLTVNWDLLGYLILQYLNGICNVPSGLPFVDLDTCSTEFSATFVVLAKFSATHASSSNFVPKIGVIYIINWNLSKWNQCGNAWRVVSLPIPLVAEGVLGDSYIVLISIRLISVHGHHFGIVVTFVERFELALTKLALRMTLTYTTVGATAADQLHTRTVLRPYGLQGLPGDVDRCSKRRYIKSTEIRHFYLLPLRRYV